MRPPSNSGNLIDYPPSKSGRKTPSTTPPARIHGTSSTTPPPLEIGPENSMFLFSRISLLKTLQSIDSLLIGSYQLFNPGGATAYFTGVNRQLPDGELSIRFVNVTKGWFSTLYYRETAIQPMINRGDIMVMMILKF